MSRVARVPVLHNLVRLSVGRQRRTMNAHSTAQEAVATRWPALRPS